MGKFSISFSLEVDAEDIDEAYSMQHRLRIALQKSIGNSDGVTDIIDLDVEEIDPFDEDEDPEYDYDGQPDESQEWFDFDPDC